MSCKGRPSGLVTELLIIESTVVLGGGEKMSLPLLRSRRF
jgi:hypothetical protein